MTIDERTSGGVSILVARGRITVEEQADVRVVDHVRRLLREGRKHVIVDMTAVPYVDTTGLRDIVEAYITSRRQDGAVKLIGVTARVRRVLEITRLLSVIDAYDSEADAIASFAPTAQPDGDR